MSFFLDVVAMKLGESPASQRWAALPGGTAGPPCSRVGARGPCGHQPFLQVLWGGEVVLGAHLTRWEGGDPFQWGSASGDVPWSCVRCLQHGKARARAAHTRHHRVRVPKTALFPCAPLAFATGGDNRRTSTDQR